MTGTTASAVLRAVTDPCPHIAAHVKHTAAQAVSGVSLHVVFACAVHSNFLITSGMLASCIGLVCPPVR